MLRVCHLRELGAAAIVTLSLAGGQALAASDDGEPTLKEEFSAERGGPRVFRKGEAAVEAVEYALGGDYAKAQARAEQSNSAAARKTVEWLYVRQSWRDAGYDRIMAFARANPGWPGVPLLIGRAEASLFLSSADATTLASHFNGRTPSSPEGYAALARLELSRGDKKAARKALLEAWYDTGLGASSEAAVAKEFSDMIGQAEYEGRMWRFVMAQDSTSALRVARAISKDHAKAAETAAALFRNEKGAEKRYKALPAAMRRAPAMRYAMARYDRKTGDIAAATEILLAAPKTHAEQIDPDQWVVEKRLIARLLAGPETKDKWRTAYRLAASHGFTSGRNLVEGEFVAGWLALTRLKEPKTALKHFTLMAQHADIRAERSRAQYWVARSQTALGAQDLATLALKAAAEAPTTYYGLLARDGLGLDPATLPITAVKPTAEDKRKVESDDLVQGARLIAKSGAGDMLGLFLWPLANRFSTPGELSAVASILHSEGAPYVALRFATFTGQRGIDLDDWAYPVRAAPDWKKMGKNIEKAMVLGLSRQESEFHPRAKSTAGARGIMQLMPTTAAMVARQYKLAGHTTAKLTDDPAYNMMLGSAHLADLIERFEGSYILALAGYNAGPGNARKWMNAYGDPRSPDADVVDWVESVPVTETRKYIQKVLQNVHVYRARLGTSASVSMTADLLRGRGASSVASSNPEEPTTCGGSGVKSIIALIRGC